MRLALGIKSDPIENRYSFPWLFDLMQSEGVEHLQLGSFFEMYQLPDAFFVELRGQAELRGVRIDSVFTAHRELGGFFRSEPGFAEVARRNAERLIEIGALVGAERVGWNPGAVMRDQISFKAEGWRRFVAAFLELRRNAYQVGVPVLTLEPMSCSAEPPTSGQEIRTLAHEAGAPADGMADFGYCLDIAHGYCDQNGTVLEDHFDLFEAAAPWTREVHLKNTDARYHSTFGFGPSELAKGIIDVSAFAERCHQLPGKQMVGYLEVGGPKLGRDDTDPLLGDSLRDSIAHLKKAWLGVSERKPARKVTLAPSVMCADPLNLGPALAQLDLLGVDMLHLDVMDGQFVPNVPLGWETMGAIARATSLPLDVHLMVEDNEGYVERFLQMRPAQITVHAESCTHLDRVLGRIRDGGAKAGVALNPHTPLDAIEYVIERVDTILLMTVNPGFAGQKLVPGAIRKIADCAARYDRPILVDGNVSFEHIPAMVAAGARGLVLGSSSLFHPADSWHANLRRTIELAEGAVR